MDLIYEPRTALYAVQILTILGLAIVARARLTRDPKIGRPIFVAFDSAGVKPALFALQTGLILVALGIEGFPRVFTVLTLYGTGVLTWLSPGAHDRACGEEGVIHGWQGLKYVELEAWRLTRDRLKFLSRGEWTEVEVPVDKRARLYQILVNMAPEREVRKSEPS